MENFGEQSRGECLGVRDMNNEGLEKMV